MTISAHTRRRATAAAFFLAVSAAMYVLSVLDPKLPPAVAAVFGGLLVVPILFGLARSKPHLEGFLVREDWRAMLDIATFTFGSVFSAVLLWHRSWAGGLLVLVAATVAQWCLARAPADPPPVSSAR